MSENVNEESLAKSEKNIKQLYPVLVNQEGKVLDGKHRLASNPNWKKEVVKTKSSVEDILVRMYAHHRRRVSQEETRNLILDLAKELELSGTLKEDIATELVKLTPYSQRYILLLLPVEYKKPMKVKAGVISAEMLQQKRLVECSRCHMASSETVERKGENLCPTCLERVKHKPEKLAYEPKPRVTTTTYKESWAHRKAVRSPQKSKMEQTILIKLAKLGLHPDTNKTFCLQSTKPDQWYERENTVIYLDGIVHIGREDRDEALRELLQKRHGAKVVSIAYEGDSEATENQIVKDIVEALK